MTHPHDKAIEAATSAIEAKLDEIGAAVLGDTEVEREIARAAVIAFLRVCKCSPRMSEEWRLMIGGSDCSIQDFAILRDALLRELEDSK